MNTPAVAWWDGAIIGISDHVAQRASDLLSQRRVRLVVNQPGTCDEQLGAVVIGGDEDRQVWFHRDGVTCDCMAGTDHGPTEPRCSHAVAAMIAWQELLDA